MAEFVHAFVTFTIRSLLMLAMRIVYRSDLSFES